jgi:signal transduction histidine kinase/ActR/RegA family two-component response regulator
MKTDNNHAIAGGGILGRYAVLAFASAIFFIAIFFLFLTLFKQKDLIERQSRVNIWFLAQTEIEYLNFMEAFDQFALDDEHMTKDVLIDRFEIFWSRLPVLLKGQQSEQLRLVEGLVETVTALVHRLDELEPELTDVSRDDRAGLANLRQSLSALHEPLREMVRNALLFDNTTLAAERRSHEDIYYQLLSLFVAVLAAGIVLFLLLHRQILKSSRLVIQAREAEHAAEGARSELVLAIESISEGFIIYDQEDRVALFNERYKELHPPIAEVIRIGVQFEELLRHAVARGGVSVPMDRAEEWITECVRSHRAPGASFESQDSSGRCLKISERRTSDGRIVGVHTDISELKQRELELTQKSALLQTTFDSIDQGIAVFDADARLQTCNELFITMHEFPPGFVAPGRSYREIVAYNAERGEYGEGEVAQHVDRQLGILADLRDLYGGQKRIERRRPNGTAIETRYIALADGSFVKIYSDITERVVAEEERSRLREQFHASQKMQAIGTLAGGIAHDFNNILGSILGNCFLLLEDLPEKNAIHERLQQIMKAGERAKALVQQILTYSRHAAFTLKPIEIDKAVAESIDLIRSSVPANIKLVADRFEKIHAAADPTQLHQVLLNLCMNAIQAIGERKGMIRISVTTVPVTPSDAALSSFVGKVSQPFFGPSDRGSTWSRMWVGGLNPGRHCRITIEDDGCGMDRPTMMRIFEPFFTTKEVGKGTGLGLAAVHGILRNHKAVVSVASSVGKGTVFEVYLPVSEDQDAVAIMPAEPVDVAGSERILLVDDDRSLLDATHAILVRSGYDVVDFSDPEQALAAFRRAPEKWDLVLTDRSMPRLSGEELAWSILQVRADIPIIMATGFSDEADEQRARQIGIKEFVFKPIVGNDLLRAIRRILVKSERPPGPRLVSVTPPKPAVAS